MRLRFWSGGAFLAAGLMFVVADRGLGDAPKPVPATKVTTTLITETVFRGQKYKTCTIDPAKDDIRVYWDDGQGNVLGNFTALQKQVASEGGKLIFAANAGMFDPTSKPCGLFVQDGNVRFPLNLRDGSGNFYLKPNGVFLIDAKHKAHVVESGDYATMIASVVSATQSGPLLLGGGDINPEFTPDSKNRKLRSGVGIMPGGQVVFVISAQLVTLYEFAELFKTKFNCKNALYLDGDISDFWTPGMVEIEGKHHFGPMIAVVAGIPQEGVTATPANP